MQLNCTGSGVIRRGVSVCRVNSLAKMWPPPLPRTSRIRPSCGSSSDQPDELGHERGRVLHAEREDPQVAEGARTAVTTLRARNTSGIVVGTSAPAAAGSAEMSTAMLPRVCSTARGA